ncbi:MAG: hypothetical protein Q7R73_00495 [bacterium]|nr:hypothetical protein [bacterium]
MNEKITDKEFILWMVIFTMLPWLVVFFWFDFSVLVLIPALVSFLVIFFVAWRKYYWTAKLFMLANCITILGFLFLFSVCNVSDMEARGWCGVLILPLVLMIFGPIIIFGPAVVALGVGGLIDHRQQKNKRIEFQNEEKK